MHFAFFKFLEWRRQQILVRDATQLLHCKGALMSTPTGPALLAMGVGVTLYSKPP